MNCKHCGQLIEDNVAFCPHCGKATAESAPRAEATHTYESIPTPEVTPVPPAAPAVEQKSRTAAGLMGILFGIFLGGLGIHNFYLGYTKKAVAQLLISILGVCLIVGPLASGIWCLIEGIMILSGSINTDANGVPLKD